MSSHFSPDITQIPNAALSSLSFLLLLCRNGRKMDLPYTIKYRRELASKLLNIPFRTLRPKNRNVQGFLLWYSDTESKWAVPNKNTHEWGPRGHTRMLAVVLSGSQRMFAGDIFIFPHNDYSLFISVSIYFERIFSPLKWHFKSWDNRNVVNVYNSLSSLTK